MSVYDTLTPAQRSLRARMASHASWANTTDPGARSRAGRDAAFRQFEDQVDPDRTLPADERLRRAKSAQRARMSQLAYQREAAKRAAREGK